VKGERREKKKIRGRRKEMRGKKRRKMWRKDKCWVLKKR
jgi:hypothetical protein